MADKVLGRDEISLYGVHYPLIGGIKPQTVSQFPGKLVIGDVSRSDQQYLSEWILSDLTGGLGVEKVIGAEVIDRFWDSDGMWTLDADGICLGPLVTTYGPTLAEAPQKMRFWGGRLYVLGTTKLYWLKNDGTWGNVLDILAGEGSISDFIIWQDSTWTTRLYDSRAAAAVYSHADTANPPTALTTDVAINSGSLYGEFDNKFLAANSAGIQWSITPADGLAFTTATIWNNRGTPTCLTSIRSLDTRDEMIVVGFPDGLYYVDFWTGKMYRALDLAGRQYANNCKGTLAMRDELYVPAQWELLKLSGSVVTDIGLTKGDGLPLGEDARFRALADCNGLVLGAAGRKLYVWNGRGWHVLFSASSTVTQVYAPTLRNDMAESDSSVKVYFAYGSGTTYQVAYVELPVAGTKRTKTAASTYTNTNSLTSSYFYGKLREWGKVAAGVDVNCRGMSANETFVIYYRRDAETAWTTLGTVTANGITSFTFNNGSGQPVGQTFKRIQFKVDAARGATTTLTPIMESFTLKYYLAPETLYGWRFTADCTQDWNGRTSEELSAAMETALGTDVMGAMIMGTSTKYIKLMNMSGSEQTGPRRDGRYQLVAVEMQ